MRRAWLVGAGVALGVGVAAAMWAATRGGSPGPGAPPTTVVTDPVASRPVARADVPHVVLVVLCTARRDQTSLHGGPTTSTPALTAIAAAGTTFDDVIAAAPWTRAASTALLTGHHPVAVGLVEPGPDRNDRRLPADLVTLAEHLRAHGYATAGLTANPNLNSLYGFHQGFDAYGQLERLWREDATRLRGDVAVERALELVDLLEPGRPRFVQLVLVDAHAPHHPTAAERRIHADPAVPEQVVAYRAALRRADEAVRRLDAGLVARGMTADNTLLAVVSDHGEGLSWPEHHGVSHGRYLSPSAVGAVWVVRGPGVAAGHRVRGLASHVDVAATMVSLAGLPPMPSPGRDHADAARGRTDRTDRDAAFSDTWFKGSSRAAVYRAQQACQVDFAPEISDVRGSAFRTGCFDRKADPTHAAPSLDDQGLDRVRAWRAERLAEAASRRPAPPVATPPELDAQLEALGYVTEGGAGEPLPDAPAGAPAPPAPVPR